MLDGLLGRGYSSKCKSLIKMTKSRIEVIRRKKNATLKFLKKDMADLIANGLDINAYGRAEGLIAEMNLTYSYDYIEKSCDFVLKHLSVMQKMRHCPEDCREAVSSLMFAAARFSNLPELRDLRDIFLERYGSSLESFANQEFVENLSSKPSTTEKKFQLMRDIASEFCIPWDSRSCEQAVSKPSAFSWEQPKVHGSLHSYDDKYKSINGKDPAQGGKHDSFPKERLEFTNDGHGLHSEKEKNILKRNELKPQSRYEVPINGYTSHNAREEPLPQAMDNHDSFFQERQKVTMDLKKVSSGSSSQGKRVGSFDGGSKQIEGRENTVPKRDGKDTLAHGKPDIISGNAGLWSKGDARDAVAGNCHGGQYDTVNSARDARKEAHKLNPYYKNALPPPYTKPNAKLKDGQYGGSVGSSFAGSDSNKSEKILQEACRPHNEGQSARPTGTSGDGHLNDHVPQDVGVGNPIPKQRSSRRRHSRSRASHDDGHLEDATVVKRRTRGRRRDDSRRGLQILFDDEHYQNVEEERMIDKLLMHYSKKTSSAYELGRARRKSRSHQSHDAGSEEDNLAQRFSKVKPNELSEMLQPPRSISLPKEQTTPAEPTKVFTRAASFQPDRSSPAKHVHPKLPDYDDLAARFAALKGR